MIGFAICTSPPRACLLSSLALILQVLLRYVHDPYTLICPPIYCQGASTGAGLGNAFLSHVRAVDGIFQVVRAFDDAEVIHVEGDVDPLRDMEIIQTELRLKDIEWVEKHLDGLKRSGRSLGNNSLADKARKEEIVRLAGNVVWCVAGADSRCRQQLRKSTRPLPSMARMSGSASGTIKRQVFLILAIFFLPALWFVP